MKSSAIVLIMATTFGLFTKKRNVPKDAELQDGVFIRCPACHQMLHNTLSRCPYCSAFLEIRCPNCDRTTSRRFERCPYCSAFLYKDKRH